ncbi:inactive tyrosine-protein kinase 7-like [Convolutriloba macropyga]|uniref:inactive tyrosine-protein kinase 7-like n=1 Tax=Convolutriloba macropyga TaxID=536237 RepID=UPI003F5242F8
MRYYQTPTKLQLLSLQLRTSILFITMAAVSSAAMLEENPFNPLPPLTAYMQEAEILVPSDVYAVKGIEKDAIVDCEISGFTPPDDASPSDQWSITWRKVGEDFSLLTNHQGISYSIKKERQTCRWSLSSPDRKEWCFDGGGPDRPFPPPANTTQLCTYQFRNVSEGSGVCSLLIKDFTQEDEGNYSVIVQYKQTKTQYVYLHIVEQSYPKECEIRSDVTEQIREEESDVTLTCTFSHAFPFIKLKNIGWAKNEMPIPRYNLLTPEEKIENSDWKNTIISTNQNKAFNGFDLKIRKVDRKDAGVYSCSTIGQSGEPIRCVYELQISFAPEASFSIHESFYAKEDEERTFECLDKANSYPTPSLYIEKIVEPGRSIEMMQGVSHHLTTAISKTKKNNAGSYRCRANNSEGHSEVIYDLLVQYVEVELRNARTREIVNDKDKEVLASENDTVVIECISRSYPRAKLTWSLKDTVINETESESSLFLRLDRIKRTQRGKYRCQGTITYYDQSNFTAVKEVQIDVKSTPRILAVTPDTPHFMNEFSDVSLVCTYTDGVPPAHAEWVYNNMSMRATSMKLPGEITSLTLNKTRVSRHESGKYTCVVTNEAGSRSEAIISITVKFQPEPNFSVHPIAIAIDGENRTFVCEDIAISYPVPTISLLYAGTEENGRRKNTDRILPKNSADNQLVTLKFVIHLTVGKERVQ